MWPWLKTTLRWLIALGSIFAMAWFMKWLGPKGILGLTLGMFVMAYLFISKNIFFTWLIKAMFNEIDVSDLIGGKRGQKQDKAPGSQTIDATVVKEPTDRNV